LITCVRNNGRAEKNTCHKTSDGGVFIIEKQMSAREITLIETEADRTVEARNGLPLSFEQAFAAHQKLVYRYASSLTRDSALAEDVAQEVFLRLHHHLDESQRGGMLRAWLLRVTANVARNFMRTRRRAAVRDQAFATETSLSAAPVAPDDELARRTQIVNAQRALAGLKEPLRSCLMLRNEGLSYREIAVALGLKESSVGALIARARTRFTKLYSKIGRER
jgi:RNA polymerase sigma factor (sigma-70 family)